MSSKATLPPAWEELWQEVYVHKRAARRSPLTLKNYRETLVSLAQFLDPKPPAMDQLDRRQSAAYLEHVASTASAATAAMRYRGLSAVFRWLAKPGPDDEPYIERNPMSGLQPPKVHEPPVPVLQ